MTRHESTQPLSSSGEGSSIRTPDTVTFGTTEHSGGSQSIEDSFANEAVQKIEVLVESLRTGGIKKMQAIYKISQILAAEPKGNDELKSESLAWYASILDGIKNITSRSNDNISLTLPSENERMNLIEEIKDMENLTGIMPKQGGVGIRMPDLRLVGRSGCQA